MEQPLEKNSDCTFVIVRHGETTANARGIIQGQSEWPLTERGEQQAIELSNKLKQFSFSACYSSDLERTERTAELIISELGIANKTSPLLRERNWGVAQGQAGAEYRAKHARALGRFAEMSEAERWHFKSTPDIETNHEIVERFLLFLRSAAAAHPGETVLVVSHGGLARMLLARLGYASQAELPPGAFKNGGYLVVTCDRENLHLKEAVGVETSAEPGFAE